jgi:transcriptional regulator with XRE-family HTH domain
MAKRKTPSVSDVLRKAIDQSGLSLYRIAVDTSIASQSLLRFKRGDQSLRLDKADLLAEYLGLELVKKRKAK